MLITRSSSTVFGHKPWSEYDLAKLTQSYKRGYSIKMISQVLKRSMTATNKAITRYGLRNQIGLRRDSGSKPVNPSIDSLMRDLKIINEAENYANNVITVVPDDLIEVQSAKPPVKRRYAIVNRRLAARIKTEDILHFVKFEHLLIELRATGCKVISLKCPHHYRHGCDYLLNNKPATRADILIFINKQRLQQGLSTYHLDEVTLH